MEKKCLKCKKIKDISEFYKYKKYYQSYCKDCFKNYTKKYRKEYLKEYLSNPENEKKQRESDKEYQRKKRALGFIDKTEEHRIWKKKHPKGAAAHALVHYYLARKKIKKEKCICGSKNVHAHHDDYFKPLKIRWMCPSCHKKYHLGILIQK